SKHLFRLCSARIFADSRCSFRTAHVRRPGLALTLNRSLPLAHVLCAAAGIVCCSSEEAPAMPCERALEFTESLYGQESPRQLYMCENADHHTFILFDARASCFENSGVRLEISTVGDIEAPALPLTMQPIRSGVYLASEVPFTLQFSPADLEGSEIKIQASRHGETGSAQHLLDWT